MFARRLVLGRRVVGGLILGAIGVWMVPGGQSNAQPPAPAPVADVPGQEVLTQGPVHEAYAEPTAQNPTAPLVVAKQPPNPVEEMPPDMKPDGDNVVWIPGYWAWDDTRTDFIWISGIWRDAPPNHSWVPGYWSQAQGGFQWTPGIWTPTAQQEVSYLPQPPQSLETSGPSTPAPSANDFWVPGNWQYVDTRYVWRAGYWTAAQPDWIWIGAHYVWTPSGYVFIPGHWDYTLERRGVLFAPVYFAAGVYTRPRFYWGPTVVIDPAVLTASFFVRPGYCHYYFGDCYGPAYVNLGFRPWFSVGVGIGYDPLFAYYSWNHRGDPRWAVDLHDRYRFYESHPEARPPRSYAESVRVGFAVGGVSVALSFNDYARRAAVAGPGRGAPMHFASVSMAQREAISRDSIRTADVARERARMETAPGGRPGPGGITEHKAMDLRTLGAAGGGHLPGAGATVSQAGAGTPGGTPAGRTPSGTPGYTPGGRTPSGTPSGTPGTNPTGRTPSGTPGFTPGGRTPGNPNGTPGGNPNGRTPGNPNGKSTDPKKDPSAGRFSFSQPHTSLKPTDPLNSGLLLPSEANSTTPGDRKSSVNDSASSGGGPAATVKPKTAANGAAANNQAQAPFLGPALFPQSAASPPAQGGKDPVRPLTLIPTRPATGSANTSAPRSATSPATAPQGKDPVRPLNLVSPPPPFGAPNSGR